LLKYCTVNRTENKQQQVSKVGRDTFVIGGQFSVSIYIWNIDERVFLTLVAWRLYLGSRAVSQLLC